MDFDIFVDHSHHFNMDHYNNHGNSHVQSNYHAQRFFPKNSTDEQHNNHPKHSTDEQHNNHHNHNILPYNEDDGDDVSCECESERNNENKKCVNTYVLLYLLFFFLLGIIFIWLAYKSYYSYEGSIDNYKYIIENWQQQPIESIRLTFDKCNQGEINLIQYKWPGTNNGCDCPDSPILKHNNKKHQFLFHKAEYEDRACQEQYMDYSCVGIVAINPIDFNRFPSKTQKEGFKLCAVLEKDNSFYSHHPNSEECPKGQIKCGNQPDYFYCTSQPQCPIFEIGFKDVSEVQDAQEQTEKGFTLLYNRKSDYKLPLVEVRVSEGEGICMKNHERGLTSGRTEYSLMKEEKTECEIDKRFIKLESSNEVQFYRANNELKLQNLLRGYEISSQYQWGLYARGYIEWKMSCRGETFDNFIHQEQTLDEILNKQKHLMTISKIYFIIISVLSSLIIICKSNCCKQRKMIQTYGLMKIVLINLQLYFITLSFEKTKQEKNFLEDIISKNCSDDYVQQQLEYLRDMLTEQIYKYNLIYMILVCIVLGIDYCLIIFYFVWKKFLKRNQYNN